MLYFAHIALTSPVHTSDTLALPSSNTLWMLSVFTTIGVSAMNGVPSAAFLSIVGLSPAASFLASSTVSFASSWNGLYTVAVCLPRRTFWRPGGVASWPLTGTFLPFLSSTWMAELALVSFADQTASTLPCNAV